VKVFARPLLLEDGDKGGDLAMTASWNLLRAEEKGTDEVHLNLADSDGRGWIFLGDADFPGWTASADGRPLRIVRAEHAFRAVQMGGPSKRVSFRYQPWTFTVGMALSLLAFMMVSGLRKLPFLR
jgi:hypothetical protein